MHNIQTNFSRFYRISKALFSGHTDKAGNLQQYPRPPKTSDVELIALACTMEALGIDSERLLYSKIRTDYPRLFACLPCRTRFNRRRRRLQPFVEQLQGKVAERLAPQSGAMIIDSVPVPVVKLAREKKYRVFRKNLETAPSKGFSAVNRGWFIGYKLHVVIFESGVVQQSGVTRGNVHDINYLKNIKELPRAKLLLGDRAYISGSLQLDLFERYEVRLKVPFNPNQKAYQKFPKRYKAKRLMVETFFAQMCDQFNLKRNYAKSYEGLLTRLSSKLSAMSLLHWINHQNGRKLAQIKHALSF